MNTLALTILQECPKYDISAIGTNRRYLFIHEFIKISTLTAKNCFLKPHVYRPSQIGCTLCDSWN